MRALLVCLMFASAAVLPADAQVVAPPRPVRIVENFLPHRATYDLKLKSARWASTITSLQGRLVSEFDDVCAGFTFNQRLVTDFVDSEGKASSGNFWVSSYESADGRSYRFSLNNIVDGSPVERTQGSAERRADGTVTASFVMPSGKSAELPSGTLFPTEFSGHIVAAAREGRRSSSGKLFEGDAEGVVYDAFAAIGSERTASAADLAVPGGERLRGLKAWPVTVTYFLPGQEDAPPEYETSFILYENGVTSDVTLDYGDFAMKATLKRIDPLNAPGC